MQISISPEVDSDGIETVPEPEVADESPSVVGDPGSDPSLAVPDPPPSVFDLLDPVVGGWRGSSARGSGAGIQSTTRGRRFRHQFAAAWRAPAASATLIPA